MLLRLPAPLLATVSLVLLAATAVPPLYEYTGGFGTVTLIDLVTGAGAQWEPLFAVVTAVVLTATSWAALLACGTAATTRAGRRAGWRPATRPRGWPWSEPRP